MAAGPVLRAADDDQHTAFGGPAGPVHDTDKVGIAAFEGNRYFFGHSCCNA